MTAAAQIGEIADSPGEFFAPAATDLIDSLISQYQRERHQVHQVVEFTRPESLGGVIQYFIDGNQDRRDRFTGTVAKLFNEEGAIGALNASYWRRALDMTDVLDFMPTKRREEWFESIEKQDTPDFEDATVRATLGTLMAQRMDFLAEKVDGIFRALSRTHVTNRPEAFAKRMILTGVTNDYGGHARTQTGHVNDLRQIIAKFMQRDEPMWQASNRLVEIARRDFRGQWLDVDGGAMRVRCYLNGNAHLEIHPDIAWRLNQILAHLHPMAIPSEFRTAPKRKQREYALMERPLPFAVLDILGEMQSVRTAPIERRFGEPDIPPVTTNPHSLEFGYGLAKDKHVMGQAAQVLESIGGVRCTDKSSAWWEFDYPAKRVINQIVVSGVVPDHQSHQFFPTPQGLAERAIELAGIEEHHRCLEPSAGTGALADLMPSPLCVEVSALHCQVLEAKGFKVLEVDFVWWFDEPEIGGEDGPRFDRILMNPPFSQGRWQAHTEAAAGLLAPGGRLVAILPSSAQGKFHLPGMACRWDGPHDNQFAGASVSVSILIAEAV